MTTRVLPIEEWYRLAHTELGSVLDRLSGANVMVVEHDGQIIGCWALMLAVHAEGVWIHPAHRGKGSVARRLWSGMRSLAASFGASSVITGARDSSVCALLENHGAQKLPQEYVLSLKGSR